MRKNRAPVYVYIDPDHPIASDFNGGIDPGHPLRTIAEAVERAGRVENAVILLSAKEETHVES